jgi:hypothetical protein
LNSSLKPYWGNPLYGILEREEETRLVLHWFMWCASSLLDGVMVFTFDSRHYTPYFRRFAQAAKILIAVERVSQIALLAKVLFGSRM